MKYFQLDILIKNKLIQVKGQISPEEQNFANFVKAYSQRKRQSSFFTQISYKIQYQGDELTVNIVFTIVFIIAQIYNAIYSSSNYVYEASIIVSIFYAFMFCCIINYGKQIFVQLICCIFALVLLLVSIEVNEFFDKYVAAMIFASLLLTFLVKGLTIIQHIIYEQDLQAGFVFESNLIVFLYLAWKGFQIVGSTLGLYAFTYSSLYSTIAVLTIVNTFKTYNLFDYDMLKLLKIFKQANISTNNNNSPNMDNHNLQKISQGRVQQKYTLSNQLNSEQGQKTDQQILKNSESIYRIIASIGIFLVGIGIFIYLIIRSNSWSKTSFDSGIYWCFISLARTCILLMFCQFQKSIFTQSKGLLEYIFLIMFDVLIIGLSATFMMFYNYFNIPIPSETIIMISISPYLVMKIFTFLNNQNHTNSCNSSLFTMFLFYMIPLSFRQIPYLQNLSIIQYVIDGIVSVYAVFILVFWSNKNSFFIIIGELKIALTQQKYKFKLIQKIKSVKLSYNQIAQTNIYVHTILLCVIYYNLNSQIKSSTVLVVAYLIIYLSPLYLYFSCLMVSHDLQSGKLKNYKPFIHNIISLVVAIAYVIFANINLFSNSHHKTWSVAILLMIFLFVSIIEFEKILIINFNNYSNVVRTITHTLFFTLIFHPFIGVFISFYYYANFDQNYLLQYCIYGFFYIWFILTFIGIIIHWVLNLTQKSKKDLFIAQYMQAQMKKINMKQDSQKILRIAKMYQIMNQKAEDLLNYIKDEKNILVVIRDDKSIQYDYELVEPDDPLAQNKIQMIAKSVRQMDLINMAYQNRAQQDEVKLKKYENPIINFFTGKYRNQIEISIPKDHNNNVVQLKRMIGKLKKAEKDVKYIQKTETYKQMAHQQQKYGQYMNRLFYFLSEPSQNISREMFTSFLYILAYNEDINEQNSNNIYDKFCLGGLLSEGKFKIFIIDFIEYKYDMKGQNIKTVIKTFCCRQIVPMILLGHQKFKYFMMRKKINVKPERKDIWLNVANEVESTQALNMFKNKQLKKKAGLLNRKGDQNKKHEDQDKGENPVDQKEQKQINKKCLTMKQMQNKKNKKNKTFKKPVNIYSILVNSLIQCYICYEKQADNFQITTIKFSISNLLSIITKIIDFVFVFGYSSVYLLIAYFKQDYASSTNWLGSVKYTVLIMVAVVLVLIYVMLIVYHKKDFERGTLGLDDNQRTLDFKSFKFYTTSILFLLGSALANYIISIGLNSFICNNSTNTLFNFSTTSCYTYEHYSYMLTSLLILVIYWPLSAITFPFLTAIDRNLQIKYKSQYQIIYLQCKFLMNGYNTILNSFDFEVQQLAGSILKVIICSALAISFYRMRPCSFELMNLIQGKIYIFLTIISFAGILCYFVGFYYSISIICAFLLIYLVYFIYGTITSYALLYNQNDHNQILQAHINNQNLKKQIIRQCQIVNIAKEVSEVNSIKPKAKNNFLQVVLSKNQKEQVMEQIEDITQSDIKLKNQDQTQNKTNSEAGKTLLNSKMGIKYMS